MDNNPQEVPKTPAKKSDHILARLMDLHPKVIDLKLDRMHRLLAILGHPERKLPPVIHVAGTNGKGSTTATIRAIAEAAGYRVHVYTSPHLVRFHERIRLAGTFIDEGDLQNILLECEAANGPDPITYFEITTAAALLAFSRSPADLCILEVGLGGRLDATNVIDDPVVTIITPISLDHQQFLGDSLAEIAFEKAGILKAGTPAIIADQMGSADSIIKEQILIRGADAVLFGQDWTIKPDSNTKQFTYSDKRGTLVLPMPVLAGHHQVMNAGLAIAALRHQSVLEIPNAAINAGLGWVRWPARLQRIKSTPLNSLLPSGSHLWLDGGHNHAAAIVIRDFLSRYGHVTEPITLIIGMMGTKDIAGFLKPLTSLITKVIAVPIAGEAGGANPAALAAAATDNGINGVIAKDISAALKMVDSQHKTGTTPIVMIAGSLYLAGIALKEAGLYPE